jgi:DNA repair protein RadC
MEMEFAFVRTLPKRRERRMPKEFKAVSIRSIPLPDSMQQILNAEAAVRYWRLAVETSPYYTGDREHCYALALNARSRVFGHYLVGTGMLNGMTVHPREVFRIAILVNAHAIILMHNHPSGDPEPSLEDISTTRDLRRAGQLLKIEICDHVIIGAGCHKSLRELGQLS